MVCHLQRDKHQDPTPSQLHVYLSLRPCVTSHAAAATQRGTVTIEGYRFLALVSYRALLQAVAASSVVVLVIHYIRGILHCVRCDYSTIF